MATSTSQNTADGAALAGAQQVCASHTDARNAAINLAALNDAGNELADIDPNTSNDPAGDIVIGFYARAAVTR